MTSPRDKSITATNTAPGSALASAATTSMITTSALRITASATTCTHRTAITRTTTTRPVGPPLAALPPPTLLEVEDPHPAALLLVILLLAALPEGPLEDLLLVDLLEDLLEDLPGALLEDLLEALLVDLPAALLEVLPPAARHLVDPLETLFQEAPLLAALLRAGAQEEVEVCLPAYPETWSRIIEREKSDRIWMGNAGAVARKGRLLNVGFSRLCS